jgi:hypothetical protein
MNHAAPHNYPNDSAHRVCTARYQVEGGLTNWAPPGQASSRDDQLGLTLAPLNPQIGWARSRAARLPWGAPLREERRRVLAQIDGRWLDVEKLAGIDRDQICAMYRNTFRGDARLPDRWVFNDFHKPTVYAFVGEGAADLHEVGAQHGPNPIRSSAAPIAASSPWTVGIRLKVGSAAPESWCSFAYRDGRLHLRRVDFEEMVRRGYIADGTLLVVHPSPTRCMQTASAPTWSQPPYELHFYPEDRSIFIYGWVRESRARTTGS